MLALRPRGDTLRILCLGAHSDDIEIGCAGTLMGWLDAYPRIEVLFGVFSATGVRADEARASAHALLQRAARADVAIGDLPDTLLASEQARAKAFAAGLRDRMSPDVILTHRLEDRHPDHRTVAEVTWQTWRDHLVLEYEIPKYDADLGQPNVYVPLSERDAARKVDHLLTQFRSQEGKAWFSGSVLESLQRLRGLECRSPSGRAEAFHARKVRLAA